MYMYFTTKKSMKFYDWEACIFLHIQPYKHIILLSNKKYCKSSNIRLEFGVDRKMTSSSRSISDIFDVPTLGLKPWKLLSSLESGIHSQKPSSLYKHSILAEVAVILRVVSEAPVVEDPPGSFKEFLELPWVRASDTLEMLLIKRVHSPRDRWSGHVALPGGKADRGEASGETAIRETFEEVGVTLDSTLAWHLGRIAHIPVWNSEMVLDAHGMWEKVCLSAISSDICVKPYVVFVLRSPDAPPMRLSEREVSAAAWVPLNAFTSYPMVDVDIPSTWRFMASGLQLPQPGWILWGLTLSVVRAMIAVAARQPVPLYPRVTSRSPIGLMGLRLYRMMGGRL
jgi:8-oxo-dGTP pyrophosphatase MutT (NUDIX family)